MISGGMPRETPSGNRVATVAPWLFTSTEKANNAKANVHGAVSTRPETSVFSSSRWALNSVSPSQATPKIAIAARIPAWKTEPRVMAVPSGLHRMMMSAPAVSMTISMVCGMVSAFMVPSACAKAGRKALDEPRMTTNTAAQMKIKREIFAERSPALLSISTSETWAAKIS